MKRIQAVLIAGLLLFVLILPQSAVAADPGIIPSSVCATDITGTTAIIRWSTSNSSDSTVYYGTSNSTPLSLHEDDATEVTDHQITLQGLLPNQVYLYYVKSDDERFPVDEDEYRSFVTLASAEGYYKITLDDDCYVCGDYDIEDRLCGEVIEVTAVVSVKGTYHICWDSISSANIVDGATFTAHEPGTHIQTFHVPETTAGIHNVYLTNTGLDDLGEDGKATLLIEPSVNLFSDSPAEYPDNEGPVGTKVTLYGHGFNANEQIRVEFNDTVISSGTAPKADTKGSWDFSYTIKDTPGGGHAFIVGLAENPKVVVVSKYFKVIPEISAPGSATVGQTIRVEGTGFQSEESDIKITFRSKSTNTEVVVVEGIHANTDGSWTEEIVVPTLQRGTYFMDASGKLTRAYDITDIEVALGPGIFLDRASAPVSDPITVSGGGFTVEETGIKVKFEEDVVASGITADRDGTWSASFDVPVSVFGPHTISASGDKTPAVENTLDTKAQITGFSRDEGAPGVLVRITGNGFHGSQTLTVAIGSATSTETLQTQSNGNVNIDFHVPRGSVEGEGNLVVTDEGGASAEIKFTVTTKTLSTVPIPVSPKDSTLRSGEVTFEWQGSTDTTGYMYILEVSRNADFSTTVFPYKEVSGSSYELTDTETLEESGTYYWRVKIVDDYGNEGEWSDYAEFRVSPISIWVWVAIGLVVLVVLMVVAYRETKFRVSE